MPFSYVIYICLLVIFKNDDVSVKVMEDKETSDGVTSYEFTVIVL